LVQQWEAGCQNGRQLFEELRALGYRGHASPVKVAVARLRRGLPPRPPASPKPATPRQLRWLLLRRREDLDHVRTAELDLLLARNPHLRLVHALAQDFGALLRERCLAQLEPWLQRAAASGIQELRSFVWGVEREYTAVANALCLPGSQGQVEGQITRLKLLKRAMYGRAKVDLLQQRVLHPV
jgi:transposase